MRDQLDLRQTNEAIRQRERRNRRMTYVTVALFVMAALLVVLTARVLPYMVQHLQPSEGLLNQALATIPLLAVLFIVGGGGMLLGVSLIVGNLVQMGQDRQRAAQVLRETAPGLLTSQSAPPAAGAVSPKTLVLGILLFLSLPCVLAPLFVGARGLIERLWPGAPEWSPLALFLGLVWVGVPLAKRLRSRSPAQGRQAAPSLAKELLTSGLRFLAFLALAGAFFLVLDRAGEWLSGVAPSPEAVGLSLLGGGLLLVMIVPFVVMMAPFYWVLRAVRRADYDGALRRVHFLRRIQPRSAAALFLEGTVLDYAGRHDEAERLLGESLVEGQRQASSDSQAVALENRGFNFLKQGRLEEAQRAFEGSIQIRPEGSGPYSGLAEVYLLQGIEPERALAFAEKALRNKGASLVIRYVDGHRWAEMWGNKAWAQALGGRQAEARGSLAVAFRKAPRGFKPEMAMLHIRAAHIERLLGNEARAIEHLRQAVELDPQGSAGRVAERALPGSA